MNKTEIKKLLVGVVSSDKLNKSRTIVVEDLKKHPVYGKYIHTRKKFLVHDETNQSKVGDKVQISESKPLSKRKRWEIVKILGKSE